MPRNSTLPALYDLFTMTEKTCEKDISGLEPIEHDGAIGGLELVHEEFLFDAPEKDRSCEALQTAPYSSDAIAIEKEPTLEATVVRRPAIIIYKRTCWILSSCIAVAVIVIAVGVGVGVGVRRSSTTAAPAPIKFVLAGIA